MKLTKVKEDEVTSMKAGHYVLVGFIALYSGLLIRSALKKAGVNL